MNKKKESDYVCTCNTNDDLECSYYKRKTIVPDDESEEKDMKNCGKDKESVEETF